MRIRVTLVLIFIFLGSAFAFATPQIPELLIYEGTEYPIQNTLLDDYFTRFPGRDPKKEDEFCSALWRGYRATYEVVDGNLFLKDIFTGVCDGSEVSALKKVVPSGERLAIDWYSDLLLAFYGENRSDPYSLDSLNTWQKYSFFEVLNGKVMEVRHFDNKGYRQFRKHQFKAYKKSKDYAEEVKRRLVEDSVTPSQIDADIENRIIFRTKRFLVKK